MVYWEKTGFLTRELLIKTYGNVRTTTKKIIRKGTPKEVYVNLVLKAQLQHSVFFTLKKTK